MRLLRLLPFFIALAAAGTLAFIACGDDDDDDGTSVPTQPAAQTVPAGGGEDVRVTISDNQFSPAEVRVGVNQEVIWEWSGRNPHSVVGTFAGERFESPRLTGAGTFAFSFPERGTLEYQCGVHGAAMSGKVIVE